MSSHTDTTPREVHKTDEERRAEWTPEESAVLRRAGTERAFTGRYWDAKEDGTYRCAGCGAELFDSDTKFDSGSGWPSVTEPKVAAAVETRTDRAYGMVRTEVVCKRCGGHLGHVFDDGPRDAGGLRYCINGCALDLEPREERQVRRSSSLAAAVRGNTIKVGRLIQPPRSGACPSPTQDSGRLPEGSACYRLILVTRIRIASSRPTKATTSMEATSSFGAPVQL